jgi:hypothetical protein
MKILEYKQYNDYYNNIKFMEYYNNIKLKFDELFPTISLNLDLIIDHIYCLYYEKMNIDDAVNYLYTSGLLFKVYTSFDGN